MEKYIYKKAKRKAEVNTSVLPGALPRCGSANSFVLLMVRGLIQEILSGNEQDPTMNIEDGELTIQGKNKLKRTSDRKTVDTPI